MSGPPPKHPSRRARRNSATAGFKTLTAAGRPVPKWPLPDDSRATAMLELSEDRAASLQGEIAREEDGRKLGRLRRNLAQAEQAAAILRLQVAQQKDLEAGLWSALWATPQAQMWDESPAFSRMLAQFVRWNVKAEQGDLDAAREARLQRKGFGLTPMDLLRARAEIERVDEAEDRGGQRRSRRAETTQQTPDEDDPRGLYAV